MRLCLLSLLSLAMSALQRVDDASSGGAVIALNNTADDRPVWADGRLAVAVAAADGSLIELARPPDTTTLALTTARDDQPFVDVAVVAAARPTTRDAAILAVARVAVPPAPRGSVLVVASVRFRGTNVVIRAFDAADGGTRATAISRTGLALSDHLPRPWRADVGGPHARVLINETVLTLDQRAPGAEDAPISVTGDVEPAYTASRVWPASAELARHVADVVRGKRVLELGAGAGLAGLACAVHGAARVVLTDLPENLPLLQRNAARNELDVSVAPFDWMAPNLGEQFDVVLAADCVFWPELFEPLLNAIEAVARPDGTVLIAVTHRLGRTDAFLEKLRRRGWSAYARPRRRDAPQNTDVYEVSFSV
jgi:predicted nicotinamide N-methyase